MKPAGDPVAPSAAPQGAGGGPASRPPAPLLPSWRTAKATPLADVCRRLEAAVACDDPIAAAHTYGLSTIVADLRDALVAAGIDWKATAAAADAVDPQAARVAADVRDRAGHQDANLRRVMERIAGPGRRP